MRLRLAYRVKWIREWIQARGVDGRPYALEMDRDEMQDRIAGLFAVESWTRHYEDTRAEIRRIVAEGEGVPEGNVSVEFRGTNVRIGVWQKEPVEINFVTRTL